MKQFFNDLKVFLQCKIYIITISLIAIASYGFAITHPAIGMDDTVVGLYFQDGLAPYVGRWSIFLLVHLLHLNITSFAPPWLMEFISIIVLLFSVTLWCVLWKRILEPKIVLPIWNYIFIAGIFISCPLISEVFVFYLHNGICTGYGITALALFCLLESLHRTGKSRKNIIICLLSASFLLTIALGFYESFIAVYIMGAVTLFFLQRLVYGRTDENTVFSSRFIDWFWKGGLSVILSLLFRTVILFLLKSIYHLDKFSVYNVDYRGFFGDLFQTAGNLSMVLKKFYVSYYLYAMTYLPITVLVIGLFLIGLFSVCYGIRNKDVLLPLCFIFLMLFPVFMSIIEGLTTRYRSAQYVPSICAFAVLLLLVNLSKAAFNGTKKIIPSLAYILLGVIVFNQCADINRWFYIDYMKYQNAVEVMEHVAYDLKKDYDISKPIIFRGAYKVPFSIIEDAYLPFSSPKYNLIVRLTDPIDVHLKEKYYSRNHMTVAETPTISTLQWGVTAFDGTATQLFRFWEMHGVDGLICETDLNKIEEAEQIRAENAMPGYPKDGYILECDDYIIVNLEN